jgi:hypothetical protein
MDGKDLHNHRPSSWPECPFPRMWLGPAFSVVLMKQNYLIHHQLMVGRKKVVKTGLERVCLVKMRLEMVLNHFLVKTWLSVAGVALHDLVAEEVA